MRSRLESLEPAWLPTFLAVAQHLNYTRAAEALFLTQPAVSRQMQGLQAAVGVKLVEQVQISRARMSSSGFRSIVQGLSCVTLQTSLGLSPALAGNT